MRATRTAFDTVDKSLKITTGGMFGFPQNRHSMDAKPFLKKVYAKKGAKHAIDGVSLHPYGSKVSAVRDQISDAHKVMLKAHDRKAKIVIGEIGWASGGKPKNYFLIKNKNGQKRLLQAVLPDAARQAQEVEHHLGLLVHLPGQRRRSGL